MALEDLIASDLEIECPACLGKGDVKVERPADQANGLGRRVISPPIDKCSR